MADVLVVDDDADFRTMVAIVLASERIPLRLAQDGEDALAQVAQRPPALVLLDVIMPGLDGPTFCRRLEEHGLRATVPVVVVTAATHPEEWERACRADAVIAKPFDLDDLLAVVTRFVRPQRTRRHGTCPDQAQPEDVA